MQLLCCCRHPPARMEQAALQMDQQASAWDSDIANDCLAHSELSPHGLPWCYRLAVAVDPNRYYTIAGKPLTMTLLMSMSWPIQSCSLVLAMVLQAGCRCAEFNGATPDENYEKVACLDAQHGPMSNLQTAACSAHSKLHGPDVAMGAPACGWAACVPLRRSRCTLTERAQTQRGVYRFSSPRGQVSFSPWQTMRPARTPTWVSSQQALERVCLHSQQYCNMSRFSDFLTGNKPTCLAQKRAVQPSQ